MRDKSREFDVTLRAKETLEEHGIVTDFVYNNSGTCETSKLMVISVNGKATKKIVKVKKNTKKNTECDYKWLDDINVVNRFGVDSNHIYVLVDEFDQLHIVPSRAYRNSIETGHYEWLTSFSNCGDRHNENPGRTFYDFNNDFLNAFEFFDM